MTRFVQPFSPHVIYIAIGILLAGIFLFSCKTPDSQSAELPDKTRVTHPDWSKNATIYEVNIRQYSDDGTFEAFTRSIPRLKEMGIDILWLMPVYPIGEKNRKGPLGSYYAVRDYKGLNPEFGNAKDFHELIEVAHAHGMKVILDWVANHTSWDHPWIIDHPDWYTRDESGNMVAPFDWTDVADLNYDNPEVNDAMLDALRYWVNEFDVDGYRCDVAGLVPVEFWTRARKALDAIKPVFMLAEAEEPHLLVDAFDMEYGWEFHHIMNYVAKGDLNCDSIEAYFVRQSERKPSGAYKMNFTSNHDENSWNGTVWERLGDGAYAFAVLSATVPGMPLVYTGQEAGLDKRLAFFDADPVQWQQHPFTDLYSALFTLKHTNQALWNGDFGGPLQRLSASNPAELFAFTREKQGQKVVVILNLSASKGTFTLHDERLIGTYTDLFTGDTVEMTSKEEIQLEPWAYQVIYQ
ncbi:MAG: alpha-amylase family glycosyl hydrolase [Bacteroidales bacterium]|nr:alpha-amylase family glycosyl hydrolase [Bacteroidales bacterium]NCD10356.1 alpha-amylase [Negativicutes bacterium]MDD2322490.1 alpha-amylase family glycosyl hydrolase [Bacteroidales bacterium]MDD3010376.1 alpha-amylase family glycosyl hydrolase [Bacteroidales bacterium]MDD3962008.1 alpha-amylase family glycosyl hydrolase [Bacteroidales bacterium]